MNPRYARHTEYPAVQTTRCEGIVETPLIPSSEPGMTERRAVVYLPHDYYGSDRRYPVFYLIHGARGNELTWIEMGNILSTVDSLRSVGAASDFILVLPNMNSYRDDRDYSFSRAKTALGTFYGIDGTVESVFIDDVVSEIDRKYRTLADKNHRAIAGMSIGALQAIHISASSPDTFGSIGLFSAMNRSFIRPGKDSRFYNGLWNKLDRQFENPPLDYCIMIGKGDFFYPHMLLFDKKLARKGYPHSLYVAEGGHEWYNWQDFARVFIEKSHALAE